MNEKIWSLKKDIYSSLPAGTLSSAELHTVVISMMSEMMSPNKTSSKVDLPSNFNMQNAQGS